MNKNTVNLNNNDYGTIRAFKQNVLTAEGHHAHIIGIKKCKIKIGEWIFVTDVLISNNLIRKCIIGMDILSICPPTMSTISELQRIIEECTFKLTQKRENNLLKLSENAIFNRNINNVDLFFEQTTINSTNNITSENASNCKDYQNLSKIKNEHEVDKNDNLITECIEFSKLKNRCLIEE